MKRFQLLFAVVCSIMLAACGTSATTGINTSAPAATIGSLSITGPWVRATASASGIDGTMGDAKIGAAYMVIANTGGDDTLIAASSDSAKTIELHNVTNQNGVMEMRPVEGGITVPASGTVEFKPGGYHMMLIGLTKDLKAGDTVGITLEFEKAGKTTATAQVRE